MGQAQRVGDVNNAGGPIVSTPQSHVFIGGQLAAVIGAAVGPHGPCPVEPIHCAPNVVSGSFKVFINGMPVVRSGDSDSCGHIRVGGSPTVFIT